MRSLIQPKWPILGVSALQVCSLATTPPRVAAFPPSNGGNCTTRGSDTSATLPLRASYSAKPPPPPVWRAPEGRRDRRAWLRCPWAVAETNRQHTNDKPRPIGGRRGACGAWPGFEPTRRAKLAARTASGRAGRAAAGDLSGQQAATRGADGSRAGRHPRRSPVHACGKPRPADAGRGFRYPVGYEV